MAAASNQQLPKSKVALAQPPFDILAKQEINSKQAKTKNSGASSTGPSSLSSSSTSYPSFDQAFEGVARLLHGRKNVIVLVGAGISTSCGIPDFRSKDDGLYNKLDLHALGLSCPEELFCYDFFQENPVPFFQFARNLYFPLGMDKKVQPSDSHKLLALLEEKKMLLRVYTQNIDGLEAVAGVSNKKIVYAHGSLRWANCIRCGKKVKSEEILSAIKRGDVPTCQVLRKKRSSSTSSINANNNNSSSNSSVSSPSNNNTPDSSQGVEDGESPGPSREPSRRNATRKRARPVTTLFAVDEDADARVQSVSSTNSNHHQDSGLVCGGVLKPGVTFFGETLSDMVRRKIEADRTKADALIVIGTSLSVAPISKVIEYLPPNVPRILINRTIVHPPSTSNTALSTPDDTNSIDGVEEEIPDFRKDYVFDAYLLGYCDDVTRALARKLFINNDAGSNVQEGMVERKKRRKTSGIVERLQNQFCGGLLSNVLQKRHSNWNAEDWADVTNVPPERVLLFPGALAAKKDGRDDSSDAVTYREVAHCDGCSKRIKGVIKKCTNCFDFDLCSDCFPKLSKTHFDGTHTFNAETAAG